MSAVDGCEQYVFGPARSYLTVFHLERELLIRMCRDLTSTSKKLIFALHRCRAVDASTAVCANAQILADILKNMRDICANTLHLDAYRPTIANAAEEMCEAFLFMYYLHTNQLASWAQIYALFNALQDAGGEGSPPILSILADFTDDQLTRTDECDVIYISEGAYFMGIFDLTGEIMRYAIGNLLDAQSHALSDESLKALNFLQDLFKDMSLFLARNPRLSVERGMISNQDSNMGKNAIVKKMEVFRQSLGKVQTNVREKLIQQLEIVE